VADYIELDLITDADTLQAAGEERLLELAPAGYTIDPLIQWMLAAVGRMAAEIAVLAGDVPDEIFQTFGQKVLGIDPYVETSATGTVEFTLSDDDGHTIEAGAQIDIDGVGFQTTTDLVVAPGDTTGQVGVVAVIAGSDGSNLTGADVTLISPTYIWVDSVTVVGATGNGTDGEDPSAYLDRLADELPALSPKAILIQDYAAIARADEEVARALAIDNLIPPSTTAEGAVTVAVLGAGGGLVSGGGKTRVEAALEAGRVLNIDVHVIDPTVTPIDVIWAGVARDGFDPATVEAEGNAALAALLSAARWGIPPGGLDTEWTDEATLTRFDLIGELYKVNGLRHVTSVTLGRAIPVTMSATTDNATSTAHGLALNDPVVLHLTGGAPLVNGTIYYARDIATNIFRVSTTPGGAAIPIDTDATGTVSKVATADVALTGPAAIPSLNSVAGDVT
jgi:hypothetical protein